MQRHPEYQYLDLLRKLLETGDTRRDRTGVGTNAIFGYTMRFDLATGFPVFTTKRIFWNMAFKEMLWMLSGVTNIRELILQGVRICTDCPLMR
jgi:thymidylate synthase